MRKTNKRKIKHSKKYNKSVRTNSNKTIQSKHYIRRTRRGGGFPSGYNPVKGIANQLGIRKKNETGVEEIDQKTAFLDKLDEYKNEIDKMNFIDIIDEITSNKLKTFLQNSIVPWYDEIKENDLSQLDSNEMRTTAGSVLTGNILIKLLGRGPGSANLNISDENVKDQIKNRIVPLLKKPYIAFTSFEKAVKNATSRLSEQ